MPGISRKRFVKGVDVKPGKFARKFWTWGDQVYWDRYEIPNADANSFETFSDEWACDKQNVFHLASRVRDADVSTFEVLNRIFCKDVKRVYCGDGVAKRCDPTTFEVMDKGIARFCGGNCGYARDAQNVYFHDDGEGNVKLIRGVSRESFRVIRGGFATDGKRFYAFGRRIPGVDPGSFRPLGKFYSRDAKQAFYLNFGMKDKVDLATFKPVGPDKARDKYRTYRMYYAH